jgi:hypothetical protein
MDDLITKARWSALREQPMEGLGTCEPVDPSKDSVWIAIDDDSRLHLFLSISEELTTIPQEVQAIAVQVVEIDRLGLVLDAHAGSHYERIFTTFANRVAQSVINEGRSPEAAVVDALNEFKAAFQNVVPEIKPSEQIGLFGELTVLMMIYLKKYGARGVLLWSGPDKERHDFIGDFCHIEVKTTTQREPRHEISMAHQLNPPPKKHLLVASVTVEKSRGGEKTIADLIDAIRFELGNDGKSIDSFERSISQMRWRDELRQTGELLRFNLIGMDLYRVNDGFPRLPPDFLMPKGMVSVRYVIDVSFLPSLGQDEVYGLLDGHQ